MTEKVFKLALTSRMMVLVLQSVSNWIISDHQTEVFRAPIDNTLINNWLDKTLNICLGGLRHWDGEYFLHIAQYGYSYENTLAFFPLYPIIVGYGARLFHVLFFKLLTIRSCCLLVAILLNIVLFCKAANILYQLTLRIFKDTNKSWYATLLFCFNPASIFFTAAYSECLFFLLTVAIMLECVTEFRFKRIWIILSLCLVTRSNGLLNIGFPAYFLLRRIILHNQSRFINICQLLLTTVIAVIPLTFFNFYAFQQFCVTNRTIDWPKQIINYASEKNFILAGEQHVRGSPWCYYSLPFPYSYVQSHYWNVGFLKYYQLKQVPNFFLALPLLSFLIWKLVLYLRRILNKFLFDSTIIQLMKEYKTLPFVLHAFVLTMCSLFFVHIQISTRLLCSATPLVYWFAADSLPPTFDKLRFRSIGGIIVLWFAVYFILGCCLFSNNLPWT